MKPRITKLSLFMLTFIMISSSIVMANNLSDIDESQYKDEINVLMEKKIIHGYADNTFKPKATISRGEFAKILKVALDLKADPEGASHFTDVEGKWYQGEVGAIFKEGLMIGVSDKEFAPDTYITKEELAVILIRAFDLEYAMEKLEIITDISDINNLPKWSKKSVFLAESIGLMKASNTEDGKMFLPKELGNREDVAKLVYELLVNKDTYNKAIKELIELPESDKTEDPKKEETGVDKSDEETPKKEESDQKGLTEDDIVSKYYKQLSSLQSSTQSRVNSLKSEAKADLASGKSIGELIGKYLDIAGEIEAEIDGKVDSIMSDMESELSKNGYGTESVDKLYTEYETIKSEIMSIGL